MGWGDHKTAGASSQEGAPARICAVTGGFTLVELVVVILLISVVSLVGMSRFFGRQSFDEWGYSDELQNALRHAHRLAINSGCDTRVLIDATGFQVNQRANCSSGAFTQPVNLLASDGTGFSGTTPDGVSVTGADLYFDTRGRPRDSGSNAVLAVTTQVDIGGRSLLIEPQTGFVHRP